MIILETNRLILRTWNDDDINPMAAISGDKRVMEYFPSTQDLNHTKKLINKISNQQNRLGYSLYAVELKSTSEMIGFVGLLDTDLDAYFTPAIEIGWRLAFEHWGKGLATETEAATTVLQYAFTELNLNEVVSFTSKPNTRSIRIMEKIWMSYQGEFNHPKLDKDDPLSLHVLYKITQQQWKIMQADQIK